MSSLGGPSRKNMTQSKSHGKKKAVENGASDAPKKSFAASRSKSLGERTVKRLRLSKALTISETTSISAACHRMAARRVDALLLTDSNALLCGILTDKDVATRVIAREMDLENTPVSEVMTRNPIFVLSDTLAVEALQRMVQGKFRHLPVVENGEVIALLDITKCLYDAISRMERAAEKGMAIAAAVEGVEKQWGACGPNNFIDAIREKMLMPTLSTIISENPKIVTVTPSDTVLSIAKKMLQFKTSSVVATVENKPCGILTSRDILMRVIVQNLDPGCTLVEKVMTPNPECATVDTPIVDALHLMNDGKFLHLPITDKDGIAVAVIDVLHITHAAIATVGNTGGVVNENASTVMQKFWDSAMTSGPLEDDSDTRSDGSFKLPASETPEFQRAYPGASLSNVFSFKIQDKRGQMHRFTCDTRSLSDLLTAILHRLDKDIEPSKLPQILYEDEDHDRVILASDTDLAAAVDHARSANWKGGEKGRGCGEDFEIVQSNAWVAAYKAVAAGAALAAGLGFLAYLKRSSS